MITMDEASIIYQSQLQTAIFTNLQHLANFNPHFFLDSRTVNQAVFGNLPSADSIPGPEAEQLALQQTYQDLPGFYDSRDFTGTYSVNDYGACNLINRKYHNSLITTYVY